MPELTYFRYDTYDTYDRLFLKSLSRRRAGGLSGKFFLPARVRKVLENRCHRRHPSSEWEIAAGIDSLGNLIVSDFFCRTDDGDETTTVLGA